MFKIIRGNRRFNNKTFATYEAARSYIRKWLRAHIEVASKARYSNPAMSRFGFKISAV